MDWNKIIKQPIKVKRVFKKEPSQDGFCAELENGEIIDISDTEWNGDQKVTNNEETLFETEKGFSVSFSKERINEVGIL